MFLSPFYRMKAKNVAKQFIRMKPSDSTLYIALYLSPFSVRCSPLSSCSFCRTVGLNGCRYNSRKQ